MASGVPPSKSSSRVSYFSHASDVHMSGTTFNNIEGDMHWTPHSKKVQRVSSSNETKTRTTSVHNSVSNTFHQASMSASETGAHTNRPSHDAYQPHSGGYSHEVWHAELDTGAASQIGSHPSKMIESAPANANVFPLQSNQHAFQGQASTVGGMGLDYSNPSIHPRQLATHELLTSSLPSSPSEYHAHGPIGIGTGTQRGGAQFPLPASGPPPELGNGVYNAVMGYSYSNATYGCEEDSDNSSMDVDCD